MSLKNAANEIFKNWAAPEEIQEFGRKLVADLQELGFRDRTIPQGTLPLFASVTQELMNSEEDNIYHLTPGHYGDGIFLRGAAFQPPGGGEKWSPRVLYIGMSAGRTTSVYIAFPETGHPDKSFQWKDREKAEKEIVEWLAEHAGNDVCAKLGWTDAINALLKPKP